MSFQTYRIFQFALSLSIALFIICASVLLTLLFKPLYYFDIQYLNIEHLSNMNRSIIIENYDYMIHFLINPVPQEFHLPSLNYSRHGQVHFQDVKKIFTFIDLLLILTGMFSASGIYFNIKNKNFQFLKSASAALILFTIVPSILFLLDFNTAFIMFHQLFFRNNYWVFDPATDPVITILPETFFLHAALLVLGLIFTGILALLIACKILSKTKN
ncbi:TIGR01906 family membrane protein [Sporolactobacillus sp. THM7-4]|nr:TIGR01906 family membrane protein [Sporolactobacillus sp. THM7-4]